MLSPNIADRGAETMSRNTIQDGDIVISRVNGPAEAYLVGRATDGLGRVQLRADQSLESAINVAFTFKTGDAKVWIVPGKDPSDTEYFEVLSPN
jgi:hypothetical protein